MDIKDRIIEKAGELFFQYGIRNISMDELASSLGMSKRTIYENFKDKEDILKSLILKIKDEREESTYTYIRASYLEQPPFSFPELFYTMMINFVRGISTEKGIKIIDAHLAKKGVND